MGFMGVEEVARMWMKGLGHCCEDEENEIGEPHFEYSVYSSRLQYRTPRKWKSFS